MMFKPRYCIVCRRPISPERSELLPETQLCLDHARAIEPLGGEFLINVSQTQRRPGRVAPPSHAVEKIRNRDAIQKLKQICQQQQSQQ